MADDKTFTNAIIKRQEQLTRWEDSDTNKCPPHTLKKDKKVQFQDGCIFLAACSSGDRDEVQVLLDRGADINTANIDGLTALHQACIDDNLDMVEFLVEHGADVDVCDNEGWTPLHATASCGFSEIARYLLRKNCNVAAVNNDGDLPYDICEDDEMEKLLKQTMDEQGVDADAARRDEEDRMMTDANAWLAAKNRGEMLVEDKHQKTGATALHVAAAKGYVKVISVLLTAGADINNKDVDGWTPLHAAAHWGMQDSCKILAENMCDMEAKNQAGQTAFDVADSELVKLLEELKLKQADLKDQQKDLHIVTIVPTGRRRSSVTRMSGGQKHNVMMKNVDQEKATLDVPAPGGEDKGKSSSSSCSEDENTSDSETEKKNELNKKTVEPNPPSERDKQPFMTTVEIKEKHTTEMPKIEETVESTEKEYIKNADENEEVKKGLKKDSEMIGDGLIIKDKLYNNGKPEKLANNNIRGKSDKDGDDLKQKSNIIKEENTNSEGDVFEEKPEKDTDANKDLINEKQNGEKVRNETPLIEEVGTKRDKDVLKRTISAPPAVMEVPKISINSKSYVKNDVKGESDTPSWRLGLRKTGSTSMVPHETTVAKVATDDKNLARSASSPRLAEEEDNKNNEKNDKPSSRRPFLSSSSFSGSDNNNSSLTDRFGGQVGLTNPHRFVSAGPTVSPYVPYSRRQQQLENERKERTEKENADKENRTNIRNSSSDNIATILSTSSTTTITTPTSSFTHHRKSYEPPKRDEETEMLRKVRAKRARETRRSTQGVTLEDVQQANAVLSKTDPSIVTTATTTTTSAILATTTIATTETPVATTSLTTDTTTTKSQDTSASSSRTSVLGNLNVNNDKDISSRVPVDVNIRRSQSTRETDTASMASWRKQREDPAKKDDDISATRSSSFRRIREGGSGYNLENSAYVPRNRTERAAERNALSMVDVGGPSGTGGNITRSASLRQERLRKQEEETALEQQRKEKEKEKGIVSDDLDGDRSSQDKDDKRHESTAIRRRKINRERRSTGIATYTPE
ncbi:hypothetical protein DPMN_180889, partial [Dreissena polymorpha]